MLNKHFFVGKIAHNAYLLAGKNYCAVIDPQRDVEIYITEAHTMRMELTHILRAHLHADFNSGHLDPTKKTGGKISIMKTAQCTA